MGKDGRDDFGDFRGPCRLESMIHDREVADVRHDRADKRAFGVVRVSRIVLSCRRDLLGCYEKHLDRARILPDAALKEMPEKVFPPVPDRPLVPHNSLVAATRMLGKRRSLALEPRTRGLMCCEKTLLCSRVMTNLCTEEWIKSQTWPKSEPRARSLRVADLFCGCGGLSLGAYEA